MEIKSEQDRADEAEQDHHQMIVEYVGSDPMDSGGCVDVRVIAFAASIPITLRFPSVRERVFIFVCLFWFWFVILFARLRVRLP